MSFSWSVLWTQAQRLNRWIFLTMTTYVFETFNLLLLKSLAVALLLLKKFEFTLIHFIVLYFITENSVRYWNSVVDIYCAPYSKQISSFLFKDSKTHQTLSRGDIAFLRLGGFNSSEIKTLTTFEIARKVAIFNCYSTLVLRLSGKIVNDNTNLSVQHKNFQLHLPRKSWLVSLDFKTNFKWKQNLVFCYIREPNIFV